MIIGLICSGGLSRKPEVRRPLTLDHIVHLTQRVTRSYKAANLDQLILVLGYEAKKILQQIPLQGMKIVINTQYRMGSSSGLDTGLRFLPEGCTALVIGLCGMPLIEPETIDHLIHCFTKTRKGITYPTYGKQIGLPIVFDAKYRDELAQLRGDAGPIDLVERFRKDAKSVKVKTEAVVREIVSSEEFEKFVGPVDETAL